MSASPPSSATAARLGPLRLGVLAALCLGAPPSAATAADHFDGPSEVDDPAIDLGGVFAWPTGDGDVAFALTIAAGLPAGEPAPYDPTVLYAIHIDEDGDSLADTSLYIQFGESNDDGAIGVRVRGVPNEAPIIGPVEQVVEGSKGARVWSGLRDDPFFHDAEGWAETVATQALALDSSRDTFAMTNALAVVVQFDAARLSSPTMRVWATAGRWPE
ncbi:MAG: DUF4331 family protein [Myxococcota bacterium]